MRSAILILIGLVLLFVAFGAVPWFSEQNILDAPQSSVPSSDSYPPMRWNDWVVLGFGALGAISIVLGLIDRIRR